MFNDKFGTPITPGSVIAYASAGYGGSRIAVAKVTQLVSRIPTRYDRSRNISNGAVNRIQAQTENGSKVSINRAERVLVLNPSILTPAQRRSLGLEN